MKSFSLAVLLAALLAPLSPRAAEVTIIQYELSGTLQLETRGFVSGSSVFDPSAPGPGGLGSLIKFRFDSSSGMPQASGDVTIETFVLSRSLSLVGVLFNQTLPFATGFDRYRLTGGPITGGHLSGKTARGSGVGIGTNSGFFHCILSPAACDAVFYTNTFIHSLQLPRTFSLSIPFASAQLPDVTWPLIGAYYTPPGDVTWAGAWVFNSSFGQLSARRSICGDRAPGGTCGTRVVTQLFGNEISRVTVAPEPRGLPLMAAALGAMFAVAAVVARRSTS